MVYKYGGATSCLGKPISAEARSQLFSATWWTIGLWHEIQNRLRYTWFDVVFYADFDSIFFRGVRNSKESRTLARESILESQIRIKNH